jgi:hypothetical protein
MTKQTNQFIENMRFEVRLAFGTSMLVLCLLAVSALVQYCFGLDLGVSGDTLEVALIVIPGTVLTYFIVDKGLGFHVQEPIAFLLRLLVRPHCTSRDD